VREIPLPRGAVALVDDEDYPRLSQYRWHLAGRDPLYAARDGKAGEAHIVYMHRDIARPGPGMTVDHIDANPLNNQRANLRVCTRTQNHANRRKTRGSSQYKGVSWEQKRARWSASIRINRSQRHLGRYVCEREAALAYDAAARETFGAYARVNFPAPGENGALG
jgi:hypothetical protein